MNTRMTVLTMLVAIAVTAAPLGTEFTYQGVLSDAGAPAVGVFDFRFILYDAEAGGSQVGVIVPVEDLTVDDGRISTQLDFGDVFDGTALWLEVGVRDGALTGTYTVLSPRQELTATPFAQHARTADTAVAATTAGHAATAGEADTLDGEHGSYYLTWANFVGIPGDLADGDDDTLADLSCNGDEIVRWNGAAWTCGEDNDTPFVRTYVVGAVGTPTQNGVALSQAMASIPTPTNQETATLLKIEPGVYDLGTGLEGLPPWIVIEGSGRDHTRITSAYCASGIYEGTFWSASDNVELRALTVENTCADSAKRSIALSNQGSWVSVENARLVASQGAHRNYAMFNSGDVVTVKGTILHAGDGTNQNAGLWNQGVGVTLDDVYIESGGGEINRGIENDGTDFTIRGGGMQLWGGISECTGLLNNTDADRLDVNGLEIDNFCSSASDNGVLIHGSSGSLRDVSVSSADTALGLHNSSGSHKGVYLREVRLNANPTGYGIWCQDESSNGLLITIQRSEIICSGVAVYNHLDECGVRIGGSHIEGGVIGSATCAGVYDGGYAYFADTCPAP